MSEDKKIKNMKVALCCIGRLENQYAVEFVEHYKKLGFDKIFIYDNNHDGEEHFEDVLQSYINENFVEIIDFRNKQAAQLLAYNDCYKKYNKKYDFIAFFDFDEFLTLVDDNDIKSYLDKFNDYDIIKINWMIYTDNNLLTNDFRPVLERFTTPMNYDKCTIYNFPENNHVKSIVRGGIKRFKWLNNPHTPKIKARYSDSVGNKSDDSPFQPYNHSKAYIKHFITKTIDEFLNKKYKKGVADRTYDTFLKTYDLSSFFKINDKNEEKEIFLTRFLEEIEKNNNLDIFICTHKEFATPVRNKAYKIVWANKIKDDITNNGLKDDFYSEFYQFKYINDNVPFKKYIGFCHYRRYFNFLDDIPDMDSIFSEYDAIVGKPIIYDTRTIKQDYANYHNVEDLYIVGGIIADKYPSYCQMWHNFINGKVFIPYNMFIMKSEDFKEYIKFIFDILDEYINIVGTNIVKRIGNNVEKYLKTNHPNNTIDYQYRIGGYIGERLTNLFILTRFKKLKTYPVIITEDKYTKKG